MARLIGNVDPATDHNFSSVWNLNSAAVEGAFKAGNWPGLVTDVTIILKVWGAGGGGTAADGG